MENASKALIIAGGVLISLLVISLLVFGFTNLKDYMSSKQSVDYTEQISEFNRQFDAYNKDIYGSELLSLANKVEDYNKKYRTEDGYTKLEIQVTFLTDESITPFNFGSKIIEKGKKYKAEDINDIVEDIEDNIKELGKLQYGTYKVKDIAGKRTNELEKLVGKEKLEECVNNINNYSRYKSALSTLKGYKFNVGEFKYNTTNGRIELMTFTKN